MDGLRFHMHMDNSSMRLGSVHSRVAYEKAYQTTQRSNSETTQIIVESNVCKHLLCYLNASFFCVAVVLLLSAFEVV